MIAREADLIIRVLKSPGYKELQEDEYEGELNRLMRDMRRKVVSRKNSRMPRIKLGKNDKRAVNKKLMERLIAQMDIPRVGGEVAMVMGGNREGVLEAFTMKAVPAYNFEIMSDRPDMKVIRDWMKEDSKEDDNAKPAKPKKAKKEEGRPTLEDYAEAF